MGFSKQRLIIVVLLALLPFVFTMACLENPTLSRNILKHSLRQIRAKSNIWIDAKDWKLNVIRFSGVIQNLEVIDQNQKTKIKELEFRISPLYLLFGKLRILETRISGVTSDINFELLKSDESKNDELNFKQFIKNLPSQIGAQAIVLDKELNKQNLSFRDIKIESLKINSPDLAIEDVYLELGNLGSHQFRLETQVKKVSLEKQKLGIIDKAVSYTHLTLPTNVAV